MSADFDAIVVGSGITGGWAARELTRRGLKTLVLERGRKIEHITDYQGEHKARARQAVEPKRAGSRPAGLCRAEPVRLV